MKNFVTREAPVPWSETPAGQEWTKEWNSVSCVPNAQHLAEHLTKADEMLISGDFKTQLRVTALSTKHLQGLHSNTHAELHLLREELMKQEQVHKIDKKNSSNLPLTGLLILRRLKKHNKLRLMIF